MQYKFLKKITIHLLRIFKNSCSVLPVLILVVNSNMEKNQYTITNENAMMEVPGEGVCL